MGWYSDVKQICPLCGSLVPSARPPGEPYTCPGCGTKLEVEKAYLQRWGIVATLVAVAAALAFGARGWHILLLVVVIWFPAAIVVASLSARLFPPRLEPWDGRKVV
jgi:hypothetical protein